MNTQLLFILIQAQHSDSSKSQNKKDPMLIGKNQIKTMTQTHLI